MKQATALLLFSVLLSFSASAEKLDVHTHDLVIEKLELVLPGLNGQASEAQVLTRLGDLYADRARLISIQEIEKNCQKCTEAKSNREKAISYYQTAFKKTSSDQQARVLLQIAHLHSSNGDLKDSKRVFTTILSRKNKYSSEIIGESLAGLGELAYMSGRFDEAKKHYIAALKHPISRAPFIQYRLAWCHLNSGDAILAKTTLLALLNEKNNIEASFRKDITHDLATFIARGEVSETTVNELLNLSRAEEKKSNLFYLGQECDRLGNKKGSIMIWGMYAKMGSISGEEGLEIKIRLAQNLWDQSQFSQSIAQYESFYKEFSAAKCKNQTFCDELRARSRSYVHTWIKKYKTNPNLELLNALKIYTTYNSDDVEMLSWTAHIAKYLKENQMAADYYSLAADKSFELLKNKNIENERIEFLKKSLEGSLLSEIECAEAAAQSKQMLAAYKHYLKLNPNGERSDEIYYQITYLEYKAGDYKSAASKFYSLAVNKNKLAQDRKIQAADLSLDATGILKNHEELEAYALRYAKAFPQKQNEYYKLARQSGVNQSAEKYNNGKGSASNLKAALAKLSAVPLIGATEDERLKIYKNQMLIAEKLRDLDAVDATALKILKLKGVSSADSDFALERRLWVAEMRLDFKSAARLAQSTSLKTMSAEERYLKLAVLTELSGRSARAYYDDYLKISKNKNQSNLVRSKLVKESRSPWNELDKQKKYLKQSSDIYGSCLLEVFAKDKNLGKLKPYLNETAIKRSSAVPILSRFVALDNNLKFDLEISRHKISKHNTKMKASLNERLNLLARADKIANQSMSSGDFTLQIESLNRVSRENRRLYADILRLPVPRGLKGQQKQEYTQLIQKQASPYLAKAQQADAKLEAIWGISKDFKELLSLAQSDVGASRSLVVAELNLLSKFANKSDKREIQFAISSKPGEVKSGEIEVARKAIAKDPFDTSKISRLKNLEEIRGGSTMVVYLEARLNAMDKGTL